MEPVAATYFDGRQARSRNVTIHVANGVAAIVGEGIDRQEPLASIHISYAIGRAPRVVRFHDGAFCEVTDTQGLARLLAANGIRSTAVSQWEGSLRWIWAGIAAFLLVIGLAYKYGIPAAAAMLANAVPAAAAERLSTEVLAMLDFQVFVPSRLPQERRDAITRAFERLALPARAEGANYRIVFRAGEGIGANAMALPSGTIVVTDALVELARDDRELLGVLAHEAGHVDRRHGLRQVLQSSLVGLAVAWFIGDVSTILAAAPTALLEANYSRDLEREADAYAVEVLRANNIPRQHLAAILRRLEEKEGRGGSEGALRYLSSHPATAERLERLGAR